MLRTVEADGNAISYTLERKPVKNINLRIRADQSVYVSVPKDVNAKMVDAFVVEKSAYILRALKKFKDKNRETVSENKFVNGETVKFLGRNLRLKIKNASRSKVESDESYVTLYVKDVQDADLKKRVLETWLRKKCKDEITAICKKVYPQVKKYGVAFPEIQLREMVSRWGSCSPKKGFVTFNTALIAMPVSCIEYVVTHEFTHFLYPNHSKKFYQQLATFMPDWEERKKRLEG
ncbi:SprT family zinc-dependent metalloprotease [Fibrobacter sp.]|uniref:M48 family metallopeptidase n=1 Tax=Fibrobacter sp. TaxID=35828 RepID=UPI0026316AE7|nr:SprT family zinc-dependent metalloprotease [Fibrobacter sp.]MDD5942012.1 SprT family zinc-dependent metalloprotease [Fibrobacter sp.]